MSIYWKGIHKTIAMKSQHIEHTFQH